MIEKHKGGKGAKGREGSGRQEAIMINRLRSQVLEKTNRITSGAAATAMAKVQEDCEEREAKKDKEMVRSFVESHLKNLPEVRSKEGTLGFIGTTRYSH